MDWDGFGVTSGRFDTVSFAKPREHSCESAHGKPVRRICCSASAVSSALLCQVHAEAPVGVWLYDDPIAYSRRES
jgi:hypothetical protein